MAICLDLATYLAEDALERIARRHNGAPRVEQDVDSADMSGVTGTPTFFINERRHDGAYDVASLSSAVRAAGARATIAP